jgi:4-hydroxyproline epimerase
MTHTFSCIDAHTCGNPVRLVSGGVPFLKGNSMFERRQYFLQHYDWIRKGLMFEPRGHDMMSGSMLYPPVDDANDVGVLFIETSGCLPMCGHGLIGTVTVAIEHGLVIPKTEGKLNVETPAGLVRVTYRQEGGKVLSVKLVNVPSFVILSDAYIDTQCLGRLHFDVSYGGNFYAIIDEQENFKGIQHYTASEIIAFSREIRVLVNEKYQVVHPENPAINYVSHVLWAGSPLHEGSTARNAVFYGEKAIDRSPCGTGTSARMAQWVQRGRLGLGQDFVHESIIGSRFTGRAEAAAQVGPYPGIVPSIEGWARVTGINTIFIDDDCPFREGFQVI